MLTKRQQDKFAQLHDMCEQYAHKLPLVWIHCQFSDRQDLIAFEGKQFARTTYFNWLPYGDTSGYFCVMHKGEMIKLCWADIMRGANVLYTYMKQHA